MEESAFLKVLLDRYDRQLQDLRDAEVWIKRLRDDIRSLEREGRASADALEKSREGLGRVLDEQRRWEHVLNLCRALHDGEVRDNADFAEDLRRRIADAVGRVPVASALIVDDPNDIPF